MHPFLAGGGWHAKSENIELVHVGFESCVLPKFTLYLIEKLSGVALQYDPLERLRRVIPSVALHGVIEECLCGWRFDSSRLECALGAQSQDERGVTFWTVVGLCPP